MISSILYRDYIPLQQQLNTDHLQLPKFLFTINRSHLALTQMSQIIWSPDLGLCFFQMNPDVVPIAWCTWPIGMLANLWWYKNCQLLESLIRKEMYLTSKLHLSDGLWSQQRLNWSNRAGMERRLSSQLLGLTLLLCISDEELKYSFMTDRPGNKQTFLKSSTCKSRAFPKYLISSWYHSTPLISLSCFLSS